MGKRLEPFPCLFVSSVVFHRSEFVLNFRRGRLDAPLIFANSNERSVRVHALEDVVLVFSVVGQADVREVAARIGLKNLRQSLGCRRNQLDHPVLI